MKIFLNLIAATRGGQVTRALAFVREFQKKMPKDKLIIVVQKGTLNDIEKTVNIDIIKIDLQGNFPVWLMRMLWENTKMIKLLHDIDPDAYLTFSHYLPLHKLNFPTVVAVSNLAPFSRSAYQNETIYGKLRLFFLKRTIVFSSNRASKVIALSKKCKSTLVENQVNECDIVVIPNGVHHRSVSVPNDRSIYKGHQSDKYILSVSHFYRYKNYQQLISAYSKLEKTVTEKYRLLLVGAFSDRAYVEGLRELSYKLGVGHRIDFIPEVSPEILNMYYKKASLFVYTSLIENSPNILLESMAAGLPVLCIDVDPMPEFGGDAVIYFEPGDDSGLAYKINHLLNSDLIRKNIGLRSKKRSNNYTWDEFTRKVIDVCQDCIDDEAKA